MKRRARLLLSTTCLSAVGLCLAAPMALANPVDGTVVGGSASISSAGNVLTVNQGSDRAVIDWRGFDIGAGETTRFVQPGSGSIAVNRINSGGASRIDGNLAANGNVVIINQNGVMFGAGSHVDVNGLVATTADINTPQFMGGGKLVFGAPGTNPGAMIVNAGQITAGEAGLVGFVAPNVVNSGVITARLGRVHLAGGDTAVVDFYGDGLMEVAVSDAVSSQLVSNTGTITADGGKIALTAAAGSTIINSLITNSGTLRAQSIGTQAGEITIAAESTNGHGGVIDQAGILDASGDHGGTVRLRGRNIAQQGIIIAEGHAGAGGTVTITATERVIDSARATVTVHGTTGTSSSGALVQGDGGTITVDGGTHLFSSGTYDAGGEHGGLITLSSRGDVLLYGVHVSTNGIHGGGTIKVGGGAAGMDPTVCNANDVKVNFSSELTADALLNGDGGHITFWGNTSLGFAGAVTAEGGSANGNGGIIEVSAGGSQPFISTQAIINASATNGVAGTLLYDPKNITIATGGMTGLVNFELVDPNSAAGNSFGGVTTVLSTGNIVVSSTGDDFNASNAGAVYLFNGATGALISTLRGGQANDAIGTSVIALTGNGNYVIRSGSWDNGTITNVGAITWGSGIGGISGTVSSTNSLVGSTASDAVGNVTALTNGNYVVSSTSWDNGTITDAGAVTWGSGTVGISGIISSTNSLIGSTTSDSVGSSVIALTNGNYVVRSFNWDNGTITNAGAATWGNGTIGISGILSSTNSLVGSAASDQVGLVVVALTNGNYVVSSYQWDNGTINSAGAATWGSGTGGTVGAVSSTNSLVGSKANDNVSSNGIYVLTNGNYVVGSYQWDNGTVADVGAATWGSGTGGTVGTISSTNSLVGSTANDYVGNYIVSLTNGNYVVRNHNWNNGTLGWAGAITWGNGATGTSGAVSSTNSLVGTHAGDVLGYDGIFALSNGNYVVLSASWSNDTQSLVGAATWGSGTGGTVGAVSSTNSLVGSQTYDMLNSMSDSPAEIKLLSNGNYLLMNQYWNNGTVTDAGAATWGSGTGGTVGVISSTNSLVGSTASDGVGFAATALTNGNYVVRSTNWDNGTITNAGAATWGSGTGGTVGLVSSTNSLVGSTASDQVGATGIFALTNGNYVVGSYLWDNGTVNSAGASTWGSGTSGISGVISSTNSLIGSTASDQVSMSALTVLTNGNYVVGSSNWDNGTVTNAGAVTWGSGTGGISGIISSSNSIIGTAASATLGVIREDTVNGTFIVPFTGSGHTYVASSSGTTLAGYDEFSDFPGASITLDPAFLTATLNTGTAVTLQASNDITVSNNITANNGSGNGGALTLQAGRSILLNANITTDNGNLNLYANEKASTGVVNAYRDAGAAVITMNTGTSIDAGSGTVTIRLDNGAGNTNTTAGDITLHDITAATMTAQTIATGSNIIFTTDTLPTSSNITSAGTLTIAPRTSGNSLGVGTGAGGMLNLAAGFLSNLTATSYTFGSSTTGDLTINTAHDFADAGVTFLSGGNITLSSGLTKATGTGTVNYNFNAYGNISNTGSAGVTASNGKVNLTFDSDYDNNTAGSTTLTSATLTTNGGNVTFNDPLTLGGALVATAGTGTLNFIGAVNGGFSLTGSAAAIALGGALGGSTPLSAVSLTATNALTLPSISAASILARTTGTTSDITLANGTTLTASDAGNAITLAAGQNFTNSSGSANPFSFSGGGRWLIYSTNPAANALNGITTGFNRYSCSYTSPGNCSGGTITIPGAGNGLLYSYTPTIAITPSAIGLTYGDIAPSLVGYSYNTIVVGQYLSAADFAADSVSVNSALTGSTTYTAGNNVGSYNVNYVSGALASTLGYGFTYANNATAITVGARSITVTATGGQSAVYGSTMGALTSSITSGSLYTGDSFSGHLGITNGIGGTTSFGTALTHANNIDVSGSPFAIVQDTLIAGGNGGNNYAITYVGASLTLGAKAIAITGFAVGNKMYDGTITASITSDGSLTAGGGAGQYVTGDAVSIDSTSAAATFNDKHVGTGKTVTATSYALTGAQSGNYSLSAQPTTTADITTTTLTVTAGNQTITYGTAVPTTSSLSYSGFVSGEDASFLTTAPTVSSAQSGVVTAGTYTGNYTAAGGVATDYSFSYFPGDLIVNAAPPTITTLPTTVEQKSQDGSLGIGIVGESMLFSTSADTGPGNVLLMPRDISGAATTHVLYSSGTPWIFLAPLSANGPRSIPGNHDGGASSNVGEGGDSNAKIIDAHTSNRHADNAPDSNAPNETGLHLYIDPTLAQRLRIVAEQAEI